MMNDDHFTFNKNMLNVLFHLGSLAPLEAKIEKKKFNGGSSKKGHEFVHHCL